MAISYEEKSISLRSMYSNYYVITGGPGVGKTTLLTALQHQGFSVVPEDARRIIQEQIQINGAALPWLNKAYYARLMLEASLQTYQQIATRKTTDAIFFDRGILDAVCYMRMEKIPVSEEWDRLIGQHPYHQKVFMLPPWEEIYTTDSERKQTWQEALDTFDQMKQTYQDYGYEVIEVPKDTVENRARYVQHIIGHDS